MIVVIISDYFLLLVIMIVAIIMLLAPISDYHVYNYTDYVLQDINSQDIFHT